MKNIPVVLSFFFILLFGLGLGLFVYDKKNSDASIIEGHSKSKISAEINTDYSLTPLQSNKWFSTLYKDFPTYPIYAFPLAYKISSDGLGISYPKPDYKEKTVFSSYSEDLLVELGGKLNRPKINSIGDWSINVKLNAVNGEDVDVFIGHGFPFSKIVVEQNSKITISSKKELKFFQPENLKSETEAKLASSIILQINENYYALYFENISKLDYSKNKLVIDNPASIMLAVLDKPSTYNLFDKHKKDIIANTKVNYSFGNEYLETRYSMTTKNSAKSLVALYPHQFETLNEQLEVLAEYQTVRGPLKLVETDSFSTSIPLISPSDHFEKTTNNEQIIKAQLKSDIEKTLKDKIPDSKNYYLGTWFGMISNLILLSDTYDLKDKKKQLIQFVKPILEESLDYYKYDKSKYSLIALKPEFGNEELNDHHFHYSYYIRLASILIENSEKLESKSLARINDMVSDIATFERSSDKYSFLRNFDLYEGHSWADGYGDTNDGNNQESSSEAINAWYSVYLWGKTTGNRNLEDIGLALYDSEINSTLFYWFDKSKIYKEPYAHRLASIVWGGKVDFSSWFSAKANMIYGIQLLPFTPASDYLGTIPNFLEYENDFIKSGGRIDEEWGDLFLMFKSYHKEIKIGSISKSLKNYDRNPKSLMLYIISKNQKS